MNFISKIRSKYIILLLLLITGFVTTQIAAQSPGDVIDGIKNANTWTEVLGLYDLISMALILILTQISKFVPGVNKITGPWRALIVTIIIVLIGAIKFGAASLGTPVVIWAIVTLVYDKLLRPKVSK